MPRRIAGIAFAVTLISALGCASAVELPQTHEYQRTLRAHMATLTEKDFAHGVTAPISKEPPKPDLEYQYRQYIATLMQQPLVGSKRGTPSINAPASLFVLSAIEGPEAVMVPPVWPEALIPFVEWDYPGNPYRDNRALRLRAFVTAAVKMMMLDAHLDTAKGLHRADWVGYQGVYLGAPYPGFKDLLPPKVQEAYKAGLRRLGQRLMDWGPRGEEPNLDMITPVGLWYVARAVDDAEFTKKVEAHARMMFTDPRYFHPAGYFVERGGVDLGFEGMTNFFVVWAALATDWDFADQAVERVYRLRAHVCLPEPDGTYTGPTAFNARLGSITWRDQWHWDGAREHAAALLTDEAAYLIKTPTDQQLAGGAARRAGMYTGQIKQNTRVRENGKLRHIRNDEIKSRPWKWRMWNTWNFPVSLNPGYESYPEGAYARRAKLQEDNSPMLKSPFERGETFVRDFAKAFTVTRQPTYAAIVHTGPVGRQRPNDGLFQFAGPLGFGGGQLSAFWTPEAGAVLQGRRRGMHWDKTFDTMEEWRLWPIHAVSGVTADGKVFTSARIIDPEVTSEIKGDAATVTAAGMISTDPKALNQAAKGSIGYARTFRIAPDGVRVETTVKGGGKLPVAELYETLPVFHRDGARGQEKLATTIEFQSGGKWAPATAEFQDGVTAVRLTRYKGAVTITFGRPRRVKLSAQEWKDTYLSRGVCRNVMIDLLEGGGKAVALDKDRTVSYQIAAVK